MERFTLMRTIGSLAPEAQCKSSCIRAKPWELVAVKARAPAILAPIKQAKAEVSDSTLIYLASSFLLETKSERLSAMEVWGVIG
jgi:hypothetical protein